MNIEQARFNMIEQQIRPWEVLDLRAVAAGGGQARGLRAGGLPLDGLRGHRGAAARGQCMLAPKVEARLLQELQLQRHEKRARDRRRLGLHGRAAGAPRAQVITLEMPKELARMAATTCAARP
jgi:protein-L-isoaspartate(D-aspartate) O-methyltransferase